MSSEKKKEDDIDDILGFSVVEVIPMEEPKVEVVKEMEITPVLKEDREAIPPPDIDYLRIIRNQSDVREHGKTAPRGLIYDQSKLNKMLDAMNNRLEPDIPLSDDYWKLRNEYYNSGRLE